MTDSGVGSPLTRSLIGRDVELAELRRALDDDRPIALVGEAGVGKTSLARAAIGASGRRRFEGGGFATLAWSPYLALQRACGRKFDGADPAAVADEVARIVGPGILFIDDLHWVHAESRRAVTALVGRTALVLGVRLGDPATDETLDGLPASVARLTLDPLPEEAAVEIARGARPDLDDDALRRIARRSGGNPLLVGELAFGGEGVATIGAAVRVRLAALDAETREAMRLLGLAAHPLPAAALGPGAGPLVSSGLAVVEGGGRLRVRHDLLGEAAVAGLEPSERRRLHNRLAEILGDDPGAAARHLALAGERERAHALALAAAESATTIGERIDHLALAADTADGPSAWPLRVRAAHLLVDAREPARARSLVSPRFGEADPMLAFIEARIQGLDYDLEGATAAVERGLANLSPGDPSTIDLEVGLRIQRARIAIMAKEPPRPTLELARSAHALAEQHGLRRAAARSALGGARFLAGDMGGVDDAAAALEMTLAEHDLEAALSIGSLLVFNLLKSSHADEAGRVAARLRPLARAARLATWDRHMAGWVAACAWHTGDLRAVVDLVASLDPAEETSLVDWYRTQVLADLGRFDEARIRAERELPAAKAGEYELGEAYWLLADIALLSGRLVDAVEYADRHAREIPGAQHRLFVELPRAWAQVELGRVADWPALTDVLPMGRGGTIELEAIRAYAGSDWGEAAERFDAAADAWAGAHARGEWRSRWAAGESRRRAGDASGARERLLALERVLEDVGHATFLARTRRSLRALGERRSVRTGRVAGSPLTERETEILGLSGRGRSDAEIATRLGISRWAVVRAAESAAAKLGAATRLEALARLASMPVRSRSSVA